MTENRLATTRIASADATEMFSGWPLVGWTALVVGTITAAVLARHGASEAAYHVLLRWTARTSLVLFLAAFVAAPLTARVRSGATRWLLANRRQLGVSFAVSHTVHLAALFALLRVAAEEEPTIVIVAGGLAYVFLFAMTATSFDRTAAWLGPRAWKALHTTGLYYLWFIFAFTYFGGARKSAVAAVSFALLVGALLLRLTTRRR